MTAPAAPPEEHVLWLRDGTELFARTVADLGDLNAPSSLPSWSLAHLLTHVARNADALRNLLSWAQTGTVTPMYASPQQRDADIEAGARRSGPAVRADLAEANGRLNAALDAMTPQAWGSAVRTARGREVQATEVVWMRIREVWVHSADLCTAVSFGTFPAALITELLADATASIGTRPGCPAVRLVAADRSWLLGDAGSGAQDIAGTPAELLAWLIGRSDGLPLRSDRALPALPAWL
jgi:maleylpyruvate isomerase